MSSFRPGGDAQAIARIAATYYGGFMGMFDAHKWPERGSDMMRKVQTRVKDHYGSIAAFVEAHEGSTPISS